MGLFDEIRTESNLPGATGKDFQTKSMDCMMRQYLLRRDGSLWVRPQGEGWAVDTSRWEPSDHSGEVVFYDNGASPVYSAYFVKGQLRILADTSDPETMLWPAEYTAPEDCLDYCPFCGSEQDNPSQYPHPFGRDGIDDGWIARCGNPSCGAEIEVSASDLKHTYPYLFNKDGVALTHEQLLHIARDLVIERWNRRANADGAED